MAFATANSPQKRQAISNHAHTVSMETKELCTAFQALTHTPYMSTERERGWEKTEGGREGRRPVIEDGCFDIYTW